MANPELLDTKRVECLRAIVLDPEKALQRLQDGVLDMPSEEFSKALQYARLPVILSESDYGARGVIYRFKTDGRIYQFTSRNGKVTLSTDQTQ